MVGKNMVDNVSGNVVVKKECRFYRGDVPCKPHKNEGVVCGHCPHYSRIEYRILIIKLGAAGDVIRTTPLLERLHKEYAFSHVTWLTEYPCFVPSDVDSVMNFDLRNVQTLLAKRFDLLINLDKDAHACSLAARLVAVKKRGFIMEKGLISPVDRRAEHKWLTGLFDDLNRRNTRSYLQEIFEICGFEYGGEKYRIDFNGKRFPELGEKPIVGLNTGCGKRWLTRLWRESNWAELAGILAGKGYQVLFLGGPDEDAKNRRLAVKTGQKYLGVRPLDEFVSLMENCELVVSGVSMAMHIAMALEKKIVILNNVFNRNEFELFGLGEIIEPPGLDCLGCFRSTCKTEDCMDRIKPSEVAAVCFKYLGNE